MHITEKGQVTIPITLREQFGFLPHTEVHFAAHNGELVLRKAGRASKKEAMLRAGLAKMRGSMTRKLTTDEIMRLTRGDRS
jgi:bifunctional DNA-binding transcriptional regulator/antitoxin component of YhaV-PrlF toxin-antitoxin module